MKVKATDTELRSEQRYSCGSGSDTPDVSVEKVDTCEVNECSASLTHKRKNLNQNTDIEFTNRAMNLQFHDVKYTVGQFSLRNRRYGKFTI